MLQRMLDEEIDQLIVELRQSLDKNEDDKIDISEVLFFSLQFSYNFNCITSPNI